MKTICFVVASEITVKAFLVDHLRALAARHEISVVVNTNDRTFLESVGFDITVIPVGIERKISPISDICAIIALWFLFRNRHYDVVHSITPKAGLLAMTAACFAGIPLRVHTFTGQVWAIRKGIAKSFLKVFDRLIAASATHVLVDSPSQRDFLISEKVVPAAKARVLANGSICGVNTARFAPNVVARETLRRELGIVEPATLFLYLGRLARDKGLLDLARAFMKIADVNRGTHLVLVGPDEENTKKEMVGLCSNYPDRIHFEQYTDYPEKFMVAADVFCLPSYREGFGMTIIEAGSVGIPSIGTRIYGIKDAIEEGVTGLLYTPRNVDELAEKMLSMIEKQDMRMLMGRKSRERVIALYSQEVVTSAFVDFYDNIFREKR